MLARDLTRTHDTLGPAPIRAGSRPATWHPASADDALAVFDRIARYCVYSCAVGSERCLEDPCCEAWQLERAASGSLAGRWLDAQD